MNNIIFTIEEEFNSNGKKIAELLSKELNIPIYDKEIIKIASKKSNISEHIFYSLEEFHLNILSYPFPMDFNMILSLQSFTEDIIPIQDKVFNEKSKVVQDLAINKSCIIMCKCSNYMLRKSSKNCINVLIYSNDKYRIKKLKETENISEKKAKKIISKKDKKLASYYGYYTTEKWDNKKTYDILINSNKLGVKGSVNILKTVFCNFNKRL